MSSLFRRLRDWARAIKRDAVALWIAARDPRTPLAAKIVAACVAAYAFSPIDLIPDFIPVLGYLDDAVLLPLGILLAIRLIPESLMTEFREAASAHQNRPASRLGLAAVLAIWMAAIKEAADHVVIDVSQAHIWDISSIAALDMAVLKFRRDGSEVEIVGMNEASKTIVDRLAVHDEPGAMDKLRAH